MPAPVGNKYAIGHEKSGPDKYTDDWLEAEALAFEEWMQRPDSVFFKSFAIERGYSPQRLAEFADKSKVFSEVYEKAKAWQECRLAVGGLTKKFEPSLTKFLLANQHGYREKSEVNGSLQLNPLASLLDKIAEMPQDSMSKG